MANNVTLSYPSAFHHQFLDLNGKPLTGGKLYTYSAGTSTPVPTYKTIGDTSSTNTNTNPIILDNAGMAYIVIETDKAYKFVLFDKNDAKIAEWDNVTGNIGGGGGSSEDIVVVGTPNEIDVSGSVTQGVKRYVISLSNSVKSTILYLVGLYTNVLNSLGNKADKVQGATAGNLAALDANGNLTDSGSKVADFKTKQTPVTDPSASGAGLEFIDSVSQDANGEIAPHKKSVQDGTTAQKGVVKLSNAIDSTSVTEAATPKAVKDAYDELNNKIVARAVFLSQAEWAVQSQLQGDPAKVYYVENGTGEDAYTVYVWKESTSEYVEVDESSIDLDGYWHDGPTTTGSGNVVTNITLGNDGVPQVEKGITALTQHQSVTDNDPTLAWGTRSKVGTIGGTDLHVTMPSNPASGKLDSTGDASNTTATFSAASTRTNISTGEKLSVMFGKIAKWFGDLGTAAFKTLVTSWSDPTSDSNIPSEKLVKYSLDGKQDSLGISASGDTGKFLNERGAFATPNYPSVPSVINNLTSTSTTDALSAAQGKALNDRKVDVMAGKIILKGNDPQVSDLWYCIAKTRATSYDNAGNVVTITRRGLFMGNLFIGTTNDTNRNIAYLYTDLLEPFTVGVVREVDGSDVYMSFWVKRSSTYDAVSFRIIFPERHGLAQDVTYPFTTRATAPDGITYPIRLFPRINTNSNIGSTTTPVYVDSNGQVQPCDPSQMNVGSASTAFYAGYAPMQEYDNGSIYQYGTWTSGGQTYPIYHVHQLKNHAINRIEVKNLQQTNCNFTIEVPDIEEAGATLDFIVEFGWYSNNANIVCGLDVEGCKPVLLRDGGTYYSDAAFYANPQGFKQIVIVRGDTYEVRRVSTT